MFWSQNTNRIEESSLELESITSSDELITHAAVCSDARGTSPLPPLLGAPALSCVLATADPNKAKCLFVALATASNQIQVVQVALAWGYPPLPDNAKGMPPANVPLNPTLKGRHVAISGLLPSTPTESHLDPAMTQISLLELIPAAYVPATKVWHPPVVLTVRTFIPTPDTPYNQEVQSVIDRWELEFDHTQTMHDAFENLGARRNSAGNPPSVGQPQSLNQLSANAC